MDGGERLRRSAGESDVANRDERDPIWTRAHGDLTRSPTARRRVRNGAAVETQISVCLEVETIVLASRGPFVRQSQRCCTRRSGVGKRVLRLLK